MPRKMPYRPGNDRIAQTYNDGFVDIFQCDDLAEPGYQPKLRATHLARLNYEKQFLGINRVFQSRQAHAEIKKVIRVPKGPVTVFHLARDHDGTWYRIELVQDPDGVFPASVDLSLSAVASEVEVLYEPEWC